MNRRTALKGIFGVAGIGAISLTSYKYFLGGAKHSRGQLKGQYELISELVEVIIPKTDTAGAKEAKVQDYVINYMEDCASNKEYNNFLNGLLDIQEESNISFGSSFVKCNKIQKVELINKLGGGSSSSGLLTKISNKISGRSFFDLLRTLTVEGYCTSSLGATQLLEYRPVPGYYNAITNLKSNQKAWALK
ncbi:MAG: gluconate 2-dehydrogenase subunit 3 family protein [Jejuia sp.]